MDLEKVPDLDEISFPISDDNKGNDDADGPADSARPIHRGSTDWSMGTKMKDAVRKWDEIVVAWNKGGEKFIKIHRVWGTRVFAENGRPNKERFANFVGIPYGTFSKYSCPDKSRRRKIGTKRGRKGQVANQIEGELKHPRRNNLFHWQIERGYLPSAELKEVEEEYKWSARRLNHQDKNILKFEGLSPRTQLQKKQWQDYWNYQLPWACVMMLKDDEFYESEHDLMKECNKTSGLYEVYYVGPTAQFSEDGDGTAKRRSDLRRRIRKYKMIQTRQALSLLGSSACNPRLLVALDTLLERFDKDLESRGLDCSSLRGRLRECNEERCNTRRKSWAARRKAEEEEDGKRTIMDLELLPKEISIRQLRNELRVEEEKLDAEEKLENGKLLKDPFKSTGEVLAETEMLKEAVTETLSEEGDKLESEEETLLDATEEETTMAKQRQHMQAELLKHSDEDDTNGDEEDSDGDEDDSDGEENDSDGDENDSDESCVLALLY